MDFDEMLEVWRAQDKVPLYGVKSDLLRLEVPREQASLRRELRRNTWGVYWASLGTGTAFLVVAFKLLSVAISRGFNPTVWDYVVLGIGTGTILSSVVAYWVSRRREALYESGFGNSLQEQIRRSLSKVEYQLSRHGRLASLLMCAPISVAMILCFWAAGRISGKSSGWFLSASFLFSIVPWFVLWDIWFKKQLLLKYRRRFSELLELLNSRE